MQTTAVHFLSDSITVPGRIVHPIKTKQTPLPVEKPRNVCYTIIRECCLHTAGGLHLSGPASGRRTFLLCPRRSTAKGVMLHDPFGNFSSAYVACNCELRRFRCRLENLYQQKMTAQLPTRAVIFLLTNRKGTDRLPDSTFFSYINHSPAGNATARLFFHSQK